MVTVTDAHVEFKTDYGSGSIRIKYEDLESLSTERSFLILFGDWGEARGRLLGFEKGYLLVGEEPANATRIRVTTILRTDSVENADSPSSRMRRRFRFWHSDVDVGAIFKDSTTHETDVTLAAKTDWRRQPSRLVLETKYRLGTEKSRGESRSKTDNELRGFAKAEYDPTGADFFVYTSHDLEYDEVDSLSLRWIAKVGPGYRIVERASLRLQLETGLAYTYESFFGGDREEVPGVAFGAEGRIGLPRNSAIEFRADYIPAVDNWVNDYRIRAEASLAIPINTYLAFKVSVSEVYDETPDENTAQNEVKTGLSLSWRFGSQVFLAPADPVAYLARVRRGPSCRISSSRSTAG